VYGFLVEKTGREKGKQSSAGGVSCTDESNGEKLWSKLDLYFHGCKLNGPTNKIMFDMRRAINVPFVSFNTHGSHNVIFLSKDL